MMYDFIVLGGGTAGLAASLTFARTLRKVLCLDIGKPCNRFAKHSHNFIGHDGDTPQQIREAAIFNLVTNYPNFQLESGAVEGLKRESGKFIVSSTVHGKKIQYQAPKVVWAAGIWDKFDMFNIQDIELFWGQSVIHCPYCHGKELANRPTGIITPKAELLKKVLPLVYNWSKDLVILTNGAPVASELEPEFLELLKSKNINLIETKVQRLKGEAGKLQKVVFSDAKEISLQALYCHPPPLLNSKDIIDELGVELEPTSLIKVNPMQETSIPGLYAAGDCTTLMRSLATANYQGFIAAAMAANALFSEDFFPNL